ncbi:MAG: cytochrome P460 family protein [Bryobacteraceae bacterium]
MRKLFLGFAGIAAVSLMVALRGANQPTASPDGPRYTAGGEMLRPQNYREWIYLSSGLGMTYGPIQSEARDREPMFDNVFVNRPAYKSFMETGNWPDKTVMILEVRSSQSKGSINNGGHYQSDVMAFEAHVKDEARFEGKWAFFPFPKNAASSKAIPTTANCYSCHAEHGAVDTTFVQFYPTLLSVAKAKGTLIQ